MKSIRSLVLMWTIVIAFWLVVPIETPGRIAWDSIGGRLPQSGWQYSAEAFGTTFYGDEEGLNFVRVAVPGPNGLLGKYGLLEINSIPTLVIEYQGDLGTGFYFTNNKLLGQFVYSCTHLGWTTGIGWFTTEPWETGPCFERDA